MALDYKGLVKNPTSKLALSGLLSKAFGGSFKGGVQTSAQITNTLAQQERQKQAAIQEDIAIKEKQRIIAELDKKVDPYSDLNWLKLPEATRVLLRPKMSAMLDENGMWTNRDKGNFWKDFTRDVEILSQSNLLAREDRRQKQADRVEKHSKMDPESDAAKKLMAEIVKIAKQNEILDGKGNSMLAESRKRKEQEDQFTQMKREVNYRTGKRKEVAEFEHDLNEEDITPSSILEDTITALDEEIEKSGELSDTVWDAHINALTTSLNSEGGVPIPRDQIEKTVAISLKNTDEALKRLPESATKPTESELDNIRSRRKKSELPEEKISQSSEADVATSFIDSIGAWLGDFLESPAPSFGVDSLKSLTNPSEEDKERRKSQVF